jgi:N-acetylglutamate synthase/N-acetylornithine aminotransferase
VQLGRKSVRKHQRLGAVVATSGNANWLSEGASGMAAALRRHLFAIAAIAASRVAA